MGQPGSEEVCNVMGNTRTGDWVLIVEDDPGVTGLLADLLEDSGYQVSAAFGDQAVPLAAADPPGLVLLDLLMPGTDGVEVFRRLKAEPRTRDVPIVFVTALPARQLSEQLRGCAPEGIIRKPFAISTVLDTAQRYLAV